MPWDDICLATVVKDQPQIIPVEFFFQSVSEYEIFYFFKKSRWTDGRQNRILHVTAQQLHI